MNLPTFTSFQTVRKIDWVPAYNENMVAQNMDDYYDRVEITAEIVTLNLNACSMRIRFTWMDQIETRDISMPKNMNVTVSYN